MAEQTILILCTLLIALLSALTKTTKQQGNLWTRITVWGWILTAAAFISAGATWYKVEKTEKAKDVQSLIVLRELELAVYELLKPYAANTDVPEIHQRFTLVPSLLDAGVFEGICDVNINSNIGRIFVARDVNSHTLNYSLMKRI